MATPKFENPSPNPVVDCNGFVHHIFNAVTGFNATKYYRLAEVRPPMTGHWGMSFDVGVPQRITLDWILFDMTWADVMNRTDQDNIIVADKETPRSQLSRWTQPLQPNSYEVTRQTPTGKKKVTLDAPGGLNTYAQWIDLHSWRLQLIAPLINMSIREWFVWLGDMGIYIFNVYPDSVAVKETEKYLEDLQAFRDKVQITQRWLNMVGYVMASVMLALLPAAIAGKGQVDDKTVEATDALIGLDDVVSASTEVLTDTASDYLEDGRRDILNSIRDLDNNTNLNLSAVEDLIGNTTKKMIENTESIIETAMNSTADFVKGLLDKSENDLIEPESKQRQAQEEINVSNGMGFALGLKRLLFKRKE